MKTLKLISIFLLIELFQANVYSQIGISANGVAPSPNAILDISSATKGLLIPRLTLSSRNAIPTTKGMLIFNIDNEHFSFNNGTNWLDIANTGEIPWVISATNSIFNNNTANVGIGTNAPTQAKLVVSGAVGGQVALFKNVSGVSIDGSNSPSVGLNYTNGSAIDTGPAAQLHLNNTGFKLKYYSSQNTGVAFTSPSSVLDFIDYRSANFGQWLNILYDSDSRLRVADKMYSKSNGNLNLIPLGAVYFKINNLHLGYGATRIANNVGNTATLYAGPYCWGVDIGSGGDMGRVHFCLDLDPSTKDYDDLFIVGSPNVENNLQATYSNFAKITRSATRDIIEIYYTTSLLTNTTELFGTLMVYGTKN